MHVCIITKKVRRGGEHVSLVSFRKSYNFLCVEKFVYFTSLLCLLTLVLELWKLSPVFRFPGLIKSLETFLIEHRSKSHVLESLATGFRSRFEYSPPPPWGQVANYSPLNSASGSQKLREAMRAQVIQGKMIGGPG